MATTVKITETYDLKTTVNKLGLIGIHTPSVNAIKRLYPGLVKNHRFLRLNKCDVTGVCASVLPADPLQVGVSAGDVAPEDLFNPILYKPVSNESFDTLQNRIYAVGQTYAGNLGSLVTEELSSNPFDIYYALLAESKKFKKAMPQSGFGLRGLYPICYQMINTYGNMVPIGTRALDGQSTEMEVPDETSVNGPTSSALSSTTKYGDAVTFRGKSVKMPKFPLHYQMEDGFNATANTVGIGDFAIPKTYVAMFIIPPARLHEFYYRMRISWTLTFSGVCTTNEFGFKATMVGSAPYVYGKGFSYSSKDTAPMETETALVDANDVAITKIMES